MSYLILQGDVIERLRAQPSNSVHCGITSPPYWNLRRYGSSGNELGREPTPAAYVARMVEVFHEFRRVLRPDGVLFINIGDSYANDGKWDGATSGKHVTGLHGDTGVGRERRHSGLKPKDRCLIPQRLIIALQDDGWWVRDEIIWHKPNGMPFSGTDRTTPAHEPIYMLTKSAKYFYDHIAIQEPAKASSLARLGQDIEHQSGSTRANGGEKSNGTMKAVRFGGDKYRDGHTKSGNEWNPSRAYSFKRTTKEADVPEQQARQHREDRDNTSYNITANKRSVWTVATGAFSEAHFATFPPTLVEPMVLAGTSERGCCPACGAPFQRVIDREQPVTRSTKSRTAPGQSPQSFLSGGRVDAYPATDTVGWYPTAESATVQARTPVVVYSLHVWPNYDLQQVRTWIEAWPHVGMRDWRRAENCERKSHFDTREAAQTMRTEMTHGHASKLAIYVCPICGKFVLGSDHKKNRKMK